LSKRLFGLISLAGLIVLPSSSALGGGAETIAISGSGVHYFGSAVVHSEEPTPTGMIRRSTDLVKLEGDLSGLILYHVTSEFDFANGTLVNRGANFFSGTVAGSEPVALHDGGSLFRVDLATGATTGEVHLGRSKDGPNNGRWFECDLVVVGTGLTPEGDGLVDYTGECTRRGAW
jgi:hypothetical protein